MKKSPSFAPESGSFATRALLIALLASAVPAGVLVPQQSHAQEYRHMNTTEKVRLARQMEELLLHENELRTGITEKNEKKRKITEEEIIMIQSRVTVLRYLIGRMGITVITSGMVEELKNELGQSKPEIPNISEPFNSPVIQREAVEKAPKPQVIPEPPASSMVDVSDLLEMLGSDPASAPLPKPVPKATTVKSDSKSNSIDDLMDDLLD